MPKEITHWIVAQKAADCAPDSHLKRVIKDNMSLYLAGSALVDSPYYAFIGGDKNLFAKAGARLHGIGGGSPFTAVLQVPAIAMGVDGNRALAFTLGALTHIIADTAFHPMVYYLTGDYDDPDAARRKKAVTLHRLLETWMDVWFAKSVTLENGGSVLRSTVGPRRGGKALTQLASSLFFARGEMGAHTLIAVASHAIIQASFKRRWIATLTGFYGRTARRDMGEFTALFYPPATAEPPLFFSKPIRYKNPFTGEAFEESLDDIAERAVHACAIWFDTIAENPDPMRLTQACQGLIAGAPLWDGRPVYFASEPQMEESLKTLSAYKTAG
jgi:hypothetical protein